MVTVSRYVHTWIIFLSGLFVEYLFQGMHNHGGDIRPDQNKFATKPENLIFRQKEKILQARLEFVKYFAFPSAYFVSFFFVSECVQLWRAKQA